LVVSLSHHTIRGNDGNSEKERATIVGIEFILLGGLRETSSLQFCNGDRRGGGIGPGPQPKLIAPRAGLFGVSGAERSPAEWHAWHRSARAAGPRVRRLLRSRMNSSEVADIAQPRPLTPFRRTPTPMVMHWPPATHRQAPWVQGEFIKAVRALRRVVTQTGTGVLRHPPCYVGTSWQRAHGASLADAPDDVMVARYCSPQARHGRRSSRRDPNRG
jgi:hypothetical protein